MTGPGGASAGNQVSDIIEATDSVSPGEGAFSQEGATARHLFYVAGADFEEKAVEILGSVARMGDGRLNRTLPRVHPQTTWLHASAIGFRGVGIRGEDADGDPVGAGLADSEAAGTTRPPVIDRYLRYVSYDFDVQFVHLPYAVADDFEVDVLSGTWVDDDDTEHAFQYACEFDRYCDWPRYPAPEFLEFKQGQMRFRTASGGRPHNAAFPGLIRVPIKKQLIKCLWHRVPYSYVESDRSYLERFLWRVNQREITLAGSTFRPGELLYEGYSFPRRGVPPFPDPDVLVPGAFSTEKIVDVEILLRICRFFDDDAPTPSHGNDVANGHNLQVWAGDRRPHYATADGGDNDTDPGTWVPTYASCPMELLWTDPDFVQDIGVLRR